MAYRSQHIEIIERLARIEEHCKTFSANLAAHTAGDEKFQEKLLGNGHAGVIQGLANKLNDADTVLSKRIAKMESTKVYVWGLVLGGGGVFIYFLNKVWGSAWHF